MLVAVFDVEGFNCKREGPRKGTNTFVPFCAGIVIVEVPSGRVRWEERCLIAPTGFLPGGVDAATVARGLQAGRNDALYLEAENVHAVAVPGATGPPHLLPEPCHGAAVPVRGGAIRRHWPVCAAWTLSFLTSQRRGFIVCPLPTSNVSWTRCASRCVAGEVGRG
jgi:hypothetical protein